MIFVYGYLPNVRARYEILFNIMNRFLAELCEWNIIGNHRIIGNIVVTPPFYNALPRNKLQATEHLKNRSSIYLECIVKQGATMIFAGYAMFEFEKLVFCSNMNYFRKLFLDNTLPETENCNWFVVPLTSVRLAQGISVWHLSRMSSSAVLSCVPTYLRGK